MSNIKVNHVVFTAVFSTVVAFSFGYGLGQYFQQTAQPEFDLSAEADEQNEQVNQNVLENDTMIQKDIPIAEFDAEGNVLPETVSAIDKHAQELIEAYLNSPLRILSVVTNENRSAIVGLATDRSETSNDAQCGSVYTQPNCYFYIDQAFGRDVLEKGYLTSKISVEGAIDIDSLEFVNETNLRYQTGEGDGGCWKRGYWNLDIVSGEITQLDSESGCVPDVPRADFPTVVE